MNSDVPCDHQIGVIYKTVSKYAVHDKEKYRYKIVDYKSGVIVKNIIIRLSTSVYCHDHIRTSSIVFEYKTQGAEIFPHNQSPCFVLIIKK